MHTAMLLHVADDGSHTCHDDNVLRFQNNDIVDVQQLWNTGEFNDSTNGLCDWIALLSNSGLHWPLARQPSAQPGIGKCNRVSPLHQPLKFLRAGEWNSTGQCVGFATLNNSCVCWPSVVGCTHHVIIWCMSFGHWKQKKSMRHLNVS